MKATALRASILQLAIQGKLVPQLEAEPAVEQIGEVLEDVPFAIPEKWRWVRIPEVLTFREGPGILKCDFQNDGVPLIRIAGMRGEIVSLDGCNFLDPQKVQKKWSHFRLELGDVVISSSASLDKVAVVDEAAVGAIPYTGLILFRSKGIVNLDYFVQFVKSPLFILQVNHQKTGGMIKHFGPTHLQRMYIPVPPQEEQRRIVERLNELLPLVDAYGKEYEALLKLNKELPGKLRASILQEAIQGKLVPQLDEEPEVKQIGLPPEDVPFAIPEKWKWVCLKEVGKIVGGGTPKTAISEYWDGGTINWFTPADLGKISGIYASESARKITERGLKESSAVMMPKGSVLFSSRAPIGHIALAEGSCCTNQGCKSLVPNIEIIDPLWGYYVMKARTPDMIDRASGTTFKEISGKGVGETYIPLPPILEQRRIIDKLVQLLKEAERLC